jgi:hypothetical protein
MPYSSVAWFFSAFNMCTIFCFNLQEKRHQDRALAMYKQVLRNDDRNIWHLVSQQIVLKIIDSKKAKFHKMKSQYLRTIVSQLTNEEQ